MFQTGSQSSFRGGGGQTFYFNLCWIAICLYFLRSNGAKKMNFPYLYVCGTIYSKIPIIRPPLGLFKSGLLRPLLNSPKGGLILEDTQSRKHIERMTETF